jgi:transposase, IS30 family
MGTILSGRRMDQRARHEARLQLCRAVPYVEVARAVGCSNSMLDHLRRQYGRKPPRLHHPLRLSLEEREEICLGLQQELSLREMGRRLGRAGSTICREVKSNGGRNGYRAWRADDRAEVQGRRPRPLKLDANIKLKQAVEEGLRDDWSPEQISERLRKEHPNNGAMQISHETIYKTLYIQGRGMLRKELAQHLRFKRTHRRPRPRAELRGRILDMVEISQRPPEVEDRAVPGHWEGDLIFGNNTKHAIGTLVERKTRFVMLLHLPEGRSAEHVRQALTKKIQQLPAQLRRSLTWDRGREMAQHAQFTIDTGVRVFFCDPHSPWQRGSNENTNGLLRQYFPKGEDLSHYSAADLDEVARQLNGRPRQTLGWMKPYEVLNELLR